VYYLPGHHLGLSVIERKRERERDRRCMIIVVMTSLILGRDESGSPSVVPVHHPSITMHSPEGGGGEGERVGKRKRRERRGRGLSMYIGM
jgi:hypothetical protein